MGNVDKLKWNRKKMGLTQREFAKRADVSVATIARLETDETAWATMQNATYDKINAVFEGDGLWPIKLDKQQNDTEEQPTNKFYVTVGNVEDTPQWARDVVKGLEEMENKKTEQDNKTLILLEFAMDGLKESETHSEFEANIKLIKRILKKY